MGSNVQVKITADVAGLQAKFAIARAEVNALGSEFRKLASSAALGNLDAAGGAKLVSLSQELLGAKQRAAALASQMEATRASAGGLGGAIADIRGKISSAFAFTGIAAAAASIAALSSKLVELGARAAEIRATADVVGITVQQYQALGEAADEAGVPTQSLVQVSERLAGMLQQARDGSGAAAEKLKLLGLSNQEITSTTFTANDALGVLHARLTDSATAWTEQNRLIEAFGRRGAPAIEILKSYSGSEADVAAAMERVNGLTAAQVSSAASLYASYKQAGTYLANTFTKALDATAEGVSRAAEASVAAFKILNPLTAALASGGAAAKAPSIGPQVKSDAAAATAALATVSTKAHEVTIEDLNALRETVDTYKTGTAERLAAMRKLAAAAKEFYPTDQIDKYREIMRQLSAEELANAAARLASEKEVTREMQASGREELRMINEKLAASKSYLEEQAGIARADAESSITIARMKLQAELSGLDGEVAAHRMSAAEKYSIAQRLVRELAELDKEELGNELQAMQPGTAAYERTADKKREIEAKLQLDLAAEKRKYLSESDAAARQEVTIWMRAVDEIEGAEGALVGDLISRRRSLSQSLLSIGAQFVQQEIANDLRAMTTRLLIRNTEMAQEKALEQGGFLYHEAIELQKSLATVRGQAAQTGAVQAGNTARLSADASAAVAGKAQQAAVQGPSIMADAAKAFSGTYASVASIPYVGWILAPAAAAAAFAAVAAYEGLASLDVGTTYVPRTGLYTLHEGEAVAPVPFARGMREAAAAGGGGGGLSGGGGGGLSTVHNYGGATFNLSDSSLRGLLKSRSNQRELLNFGAKAIRRGARP